MNDQDRLIEGIRRAHRAGEMEAARVLGTQLRAMQAAPAPEGGGWLETAKDAALAVAFPHRMLADTVMRQIERGGEQAMALPGQAADFVKDQARTTGTHYRTLAHGIGLADAPSEEDAAHYRQDVIEGAATAAGGAIGRGLSNTVTGGLKYLGRGFRTPAGADRFLAREAQHVTEGAGGRVPISELIAPALSGGAVATAVDASDPTPYELTDKPVAGGAGLATAAGVAKNTIDDLLLQNPRYRDLVTRPSRGTVGAAIGGVLGYMAAKGVEVGAELVDDVVKFFGGGEPAGEPAPGPQGALAQPQQLAGATDITGPLPARRSEPPPPKDEMTVMAELLAGRAVPPKRGFPDERQAMIAQLVQGGREQIGRMGQAASDPNVVANLLLGMAPGSGDAMAAIESQQAGQRMAEAFRAGDYGGAAGAGLESLAAGVGVLPMIPNLAGIVRAASEAGGVPRGIFEAWVPSYTNPSEHAAVQIHKNPSRPEVDRMLSRSAHATLRSIRDAEGNLYVWDANEAIHSSIAEGLGIKNYKEGIIVPQE